MDRPLWTKNDLGYTAPTMTLRRDAFSLQDGLQLLVEGTAFLDDIEYTTFNERSFHVVVEVHHLHMPPNPILSDTLSEEHAGGKKKWFQQTDLL